MIPYIKYYIAKNPAFGKPFDPVQAPSVEEWEMLLGYEPTKVNPNYVQFAIDYIERATASNERLAECEFAVQKVGISDESDIKRTEEQEDFVRWHFIGTEFRNE
jgi:hypothetical protein